MRCSAFQLVPATLSREFLSAVSKSYIAALYRIRLAGPSTVLKGVPELVAPSPVEGGARELQRLKVSPASSAAGPA